MALKKPYENKSYVTKNNPYITISNTHKKTGEMYSKNVNAKNKSLEKKLAKT